MLSKSIRDDQKGFMKVKYVGEDIRLLYDVLLYAETKNIPGFLLRLSTASPGHLLVKLQ